MFILYGIVVILVVVVAHEFGHYLAAKLLGVPVREFAAGFGPKVLAKLTNHQLFIDSITNSSKTNMFYPKI